LRCIRLRRLGALLKCGDTTQPQAQRFSLFEGAGFLQPMHNTVTAHATCDGGVIKNVRETIPDS
ncbi:MAG: hypothetical protein ACE5LB_01975, partial [Acidiferrobacterales bacterium]